MGYESAGHPAISGGPRQASSAPLRIAALGVLAAAALLTFVLASAPAAHAGSYRVASCSASNPSSAPWASARNHSNLATTDTCPSQPASGIVQVEPTGSVSGSSYGQWRFDRHDDEITITGLTAAAKLQQQGNYRATLYVDGGAGRVNLGTGLSNGIWQTYAWSGAGRYHAVLELYCTSAGCSTASGSHVRMNNMLVTLSDAQAPATQAPSGSLLSAGGKRGNQTISFTSSDQGGGVREQYVTVDGTTVASVTHGCSLTSAGTAKAKQPCPASKSHSFTINTDALNEGTRAVRACARDFGEPSAGNAACVGPYNVRVDRTAPDPTISSPAANAYLPTPTPTLSGSAGSATGDSSTVTLKVYSGATASGSPVQTHSVTRSGSSWSQQLTSLSDGTYTATVTQSDDVPNTKTSEPRTFHVDTTAPTVTITEPAENQKYFVDRPTFRGTAGSATSDAQQVQLTVRDQSNTVVQTVTGNRVGPDWAAQATSALPDGRYTVEAAQSDLAGNVGQSAAVAFEVDAIGSDKCAGPGSVTVADGFAGETYVSVRAKSSGSKTYVCYRAQEGPVPYLGGNFEIDSGGGINPPRVDEESGACPPLNAGTIGPTEVPYAIGSETTESETWICIQVGTVKRRVIVPSDPLSPPQPPSHHPDMSPLDAPEPPKIDPAYPSATCQQTEGESGRIANAGLTDGRLFLYRAQPAPSHAQLCVRYEGTAAVGGMLSVDATGTPGSPPINLGRDSNSGYCQTNVITQTVPEHVLVKIEPTGSQPSVCVEALGDSNPSRIRERVFVDQGGSLVAPRVTFAPDPGTPVPPVGG